MVLRSIVLRVVVGFVLALGAMVGSGASSVRAVSPLFEPRIAIVWPHDGHGHPTAVAQSRAVNVSIWPTDSVRCTPPPDIPLSSLVVLGVAKNNDPVTPVTVSPQWIQRTVHGVTFPSVEFNNVPADLAADPSAKFSFAVVGGILPGGPSEISNVWIHAADPRTYYPQPVVPTGFTDMPLPTVDLRIQIVWPHDAQGQYAPVDQATRVNVAVDLFEHGTLKSVGPDFPPASVSPPHLRIADGNSPLQESGVSAQKISYTVNGQVYPRWVFNDVPVVPGHQYHFMAEISGQFAYHSQFSSIWTHAADARTILPNPQVPPACAP